MLLPSSFASESVSATNSISIRLFYFSNLCFIAMVKELSQNLRSSFFYALKEKPGNFRLALVRNLLEEDGACHDRKTNPEATK
jgi:hypothetical protein